MDDGIRIRLLGPVRILPHTGGGAPFTPGEQALLAALALRAGRRVQTDQLIEDLYHDDAPASARRIVVNYVHRLRARFDTGDTGGAGPVGVRPAASLIESGSGGYTLRLTADAVDALRFGRLTAQARACAGDRRPDRALALLEEALGMWQGPALPGLPGPYAESQRRILGEQRATAVEQHLGMLLESGMHEVAIPRILLALEGDRYRERLYVFLMIALYRSGRTAEALDAYTRATAVASTSLSAARAAVTSGTESSK
ncbi:AfsR/SARP family transcriptional regulator, partial [Streptomyces sp. URMC 123]|uniref:AfsR/SARP family transcriptional regulator n=1 Tax=Streptomyces sp. URMC 123 TaxID=3423403 RepID=UPI003F1ACE59